MAVSQCVAGLVVEHLLRRGDQLDSAPAPAGRFSWR